MEQIAEQEPGIKEALAAEKIFMQNRESYLAYMHDWKLIMQERSYKVQLSAALEQAAAESEARAKARLKAEQKARLEAEQKTREEMARKMLKAGMAPDAVAEFSGIPVKELRGS